MIKAEIKNEEKILCGILLILFLATFAVPFGYMLYTKIAEGNPCAITADMGREATVDGYESPEEVAEYVLYWIQQDDLDFALRGCAVEEVAANFSLQGYCEVMDTFPYTDMLAPADYDSGAYIKINQTRMTTVYSDMLEQCMGTIGLEYNVEILDIYSDIPDDADGFYYQEIRDICSIVGARDVCNVRVNMLVDGIPRQMSVTVGRYKKYWKIIQFSEYKNYQYIEPQISEFSNEGQKNELPIAWEEMESQILPCNYVIVSDAVEDDVETLIKQWFIYVQRGDIWKALSYCDIYDSEIGLYPDSIFFSKQSIMAEQLQQVYYKMLLYDEDSLNWIYQNVKSEAVNLISLLDSQNMVYTRLRSINIVEEEEGYIKCKVRYGYSLKSFTSVIELSYREGWKITNIE